MRARNSVKVWIWTTVISVGMLTSSVTLSPSVAQPLGTAPAPTGASDSRWQARAELLSKSYGAMPGGAGRLYSTAYNLYWSRRYEEAAVHFTAATMLGDDARAWMYKGLSEAALGDSENSVVSIRRGWQLNDAGRGAGGLGRALERVQGQQRMWLEGLRTEPVQTDLADRAMMLEMQKRLARLEAQLADANRKLAAVPAPAAAPAPSPAPAVPAPAVIPPKPREMASVTGKPGVKPAPRRVPVVKPRPKPVEAGDPTPMVTTNPAAKVTLKGAGATFPANLYARWFGDFQAAFPEIGIDYQSQGSGAGVRNFIQKQVDFGASDAAMTDEEIAQVPDGVVLVPVTAGSIAIAYNLPEGPELLQLSRDVYAGIFLGEITNWNDPKVAACNPDVTLPDLPITVVRRGVSSGTTYVFTRHLSAVSQAWADGPGVGTTVAWPVGVPAKKNADMADRIRQTPGSIGYVEYGFATEAKLSVAALENQAGAYITPLPQNTQVSLGEIVLPANLRGFVSDPKGDAAYPIVSYTWLLCYQKYDDPEKAKALKQLLNYCLTKGQVVSSDLGFIPLPTDVVQTVSAYVEENVGRAEVVSQFVSTTPEEAPVEPMPEAGALAAITLRGSGATFPSKLYERWFSQFGNDNPGVKVEYQSLGSGAGVRNFIQKQVDFGASDAAMTDEEIAQVPDGVVLVPLTAGSIALAYNVPNVSEGLKLSRDVYSGIFLGEITNWNDPAIIASNPGVELPDLPIVVVRRGVSSGTTFVFTRHLSTISEAWESGPGTGTTVEWPVGLPAKKNSDMAEKIRSTAGAIGYLEYGYARDAKLSVAALENQAGAFIQPLAENTQVGLGEVVLPENLRGFVSDPQDVAAYPIISYTWLLCYRQYENPDVAAALKRLIDFCLTEGQKSSAEMGYIPLPGDIARTVRRVADRDIGRPLDE